MRRQNRNTPMYPEIVGSKYYMPKRTARLLGGFNQSQPHSFVTNFYEVNLHSSLQKVYMYEAKFPEFVPSDSSQIVGRCLNQLKNELRKNIGFLCYSGKIVYGSLDIKHPFTLQTKIQNGQLQIEFKPIKQLSINELLANPKTRPPIFHFLNSKLKLCLRHANICELGKAGQFYQKDQLVEGSKKNDMLQQYQYLEQAGMNVLRGYRFTLAMIQGRMKLQLDVCSRVLQKNNLLEEFMDFVGSNQELAAYFKGATVITRYGNYRTYKIYQVDFTLSPGSTFDFKGQQTSYYQYYKKAYNVDIHDYKQPLLKVLAQVRKQFNKNQQIDHKPEYIYLIPELVSLTGMKQQQRSDFLSMQTLAPFTKLSPNDRFNESYKILTTLNQAKQTLEIGRQSQVKGFMLQEPIIKFKQYVPIKSGSIANRGELFRHHLFVNWMFVYSKQGEQDFRQAQSAQNYLKQASQAYGIKFNVPFYLQIPSKLNNLDAEMFCEQIRAAISKCKQQVELVLIILKPREVNFYGKIKDMLTNEFGTPCQVIQSKSLNRGKSILSVASKIAIQMSCKAGDSPWIVQNRIPYFRNKSFAYSAISSSKGKGKGGFTVSFVGTINITCSQVYSNYVLDIKKKQHIDGLHLKTWFVAWIKCYYLKNKILPQTLIVYRQSVGDSLIRYVVQKQVHMLKHCIEQVQKKTKKPEYNPQIIYIIVNKRINSRFFLYNQSNTFNPQPGSIVVQQMSDDKFDFHLVAQKVTQGTSTPTQYIVAYDSSTIPQEDLIRFTYEQCYNYYNWQGSVKVPACLQNANKLSKLAGESIKENFVDSALSSSYYFL